MMKYFEGSFHIFAVGVNKYNVWNLVYNSFGVPMCHIRVILLCSISNHAE